MQLHGDWYQSGQSQRLAVTAEIDDSGNVLIRSIEQGVLASASIKSLDFSDRLGNIPRSLTFADGSRFETTENDLVDQIQMQHMGRNASTWVHRLEASWSAALLALAITVGIVYAFVQFGLPPIAARVASKVPLEMETSIGEQGMQFADQAILEDSELSLARREAISEQFFAMLESIESRYEYRLYFRRGVGPNAFALPGGFVVMTDELVELSENDDEILAVLAHEIGHVEEQHGLRILIQNSAATAIVVTATGDVSGVAGLAASIPAMMMKSKNSRIAEADADRFAVDLFEKSGRDATALADILERLYESFGGPDKASYIDSHPGILERVGAIEAQINE